MGALAVFLLGTITAVAGAELIVRGSSQLAARAGISPLVIGLTVVAVGTSTPELAVGIDAALRDNASLAVGNIAGTNTVNILLILGASAALQPIALHLRTFRLDLPVMAAGALALTLLAADGRLTRWESAALVAGGAAYTGLIIRSTRRESLAARAEFAREYGEEGGPPRRGELIRTLLILVGGIAAVVVGSIWLVDGAVELARKLGVSDGFIGLTVVALGTSSPELVTAIVATLRRARDVAVGNLLGSSIYNILLILGITGVVAPHGIDIDRDIVRVDIPVMLASVVACVPVFITGRQVTRVEGALFVAAYAVYLSYLLLART